MASATASSTARVVSSWSGHCSSSTRAAVIASGNVAPRTQRADDVGEHTRREVAARMTVGQRSCADTDREPATGQCPDRCNAHDAAATLAVVERLVRRAPATFVQRRQTCPAGRPLMVQHPLVEQPATVLCGPEPVLVPQSVGEVLDEREPRAEVRRGRGRGGLDAADRAILGAEPSEVGTTDRRHVVGLAALVVLRLRSEQSLGGEQRHLRVVGDRADCPVRREEPRDTFGAVACPDVGQLIELDRRTERVANRATKETAEHAFTFRRHVTSILGRKKGAKTRQQREIRDKHRNAFPQSGR